MDTKTMIREVKSAAEKHKNDRKFTGQTIITDMCNDIIPKLKKLAEYETAEEEGRLVVLPCKVGDTVWVTTHPFNVFDDFDFYTEAQDEIYVSYISSMTFYEDSNQYRIYSKETKQFINAYFMESDFGKTVFLTREEAEKALKEMEG